MIFAVNSSGQTIELVAARILAGIDAAGSPLARENRARIQGACSRENGRWNGFPAWECTDRCH